MQSSILHNLQAQEPGEEEPLIPVSEKTVYVDGSPWPLFLSPSLILYTSMADGYGIRSSLD